MLTLRVRKKPKIILWDIETLPNLKEVLKVFPGLSAYPGLTMKASITSIICVGWKELDSKQTHCISAWDFKPWKKNVNDDYELCKAAYEVLKDADCVVTHNGKRFDWKFLQTRLAINGLPSLPKITHIDTCSEAKRNLLMFNNRLNTLGEKLVNEKKLDHDGWEMWEKVWNRDKKAMIKMVSYCKQDVKLLEKIFKKLRPFAKLPNYNNFCDPLGQSCANCGNPKLVKWGVAAKQQNLVQRYMCKSCGTYNYTPLKSVSKPFRTL